jgi:hypothetical protein
MGYQSIWIPRRRTCHAVPGDIGALARLNQRFRSWRWDFLWQNHGHERQRHAHLLHETSLPAKPSVLAGAFRCAANRDSPHCIDHMGLARLDEAR